MKNSWSKLSKPRKKQLPEPLDRLSTMRFFPFFILDLYMKTSGFFFAALLGLGVSNVAFAQTIVPGTPGATTAPMTTGTVAPGQVGTSTGAVPGSINTPVGATPAGAINAPIGATPAGTVYSPGTTVPATGTLNGTQPVGTSPVTPGATRRTTTGSRTTTKTVRP